MVMKTDWNPLEGHPPYRLIAACWFAFAAYLYWWRL